VARLLACCAGAHFCGSCGAAAACALLGRQVDSSTYIKGEECLDSLKDLQQFLHRDDPVGEIDQVRRPGCPERPTAALPCALRELLWRACMCMRMQATLHAA